MDTTAHIDPKPPISYARRRPDGSWFVAVTWQNGRQEDTGRFPSAGAAEEFIKQQLQAWHDGQRALNLKARPLAGAN
jgi:hypothetical protein